MHIVIASTKIEIRAAYRLQASERLEEGRRLFKELRILVPKAQVSNLDGTIKVPSNPGVPIVRLLTRLGFSSQASNPCLFRREDMDVRVVKTRDAWDDLLYIIPH